MKLAQSVFLSKWFIAPVHPSHSSSTNPALSRYATVWYYFQSHKDTENWYKQRLEDLMGDAPGDEFLPTALTLSCRTNLAEATTPQVE